jgi:hypothetical protein
MNCLQRYLGSKKRDFPEIIKIISAWFLILGSSGREDGKWPAVVCGNKARRKKNDDILTGRYQRLEVDMYRKDK